MRRDGQCQRRCEYLALPPADRSSSLNRAIAGEQPDANGVSCPVVADPSPRPVV